MVKNVKKISHSKLNQIFDPEARFKGCSKNKLELFHYTYLFELATAVTLTFNELSSTYLSRYLVVG